MRTLLVSCLVLILMLPALQAAPLLPQGSSTIVAFGDSTTAPRSGVTTYSTILGTELPLYGIDANVINAGVGGNTTNLAMARFQTDVLDQNPDLVVIQFGINDSTYDVWKTPPATTPRVALSTYTSNLTSMVQTLKNNGTQVILMTPNALRWTAQTLDLYGISPYDPNDPMGFNATITPYCQAVRDIAATQSVPLIDVYNMYLAYDAVAGQSMDDLLLDGMHPNNQGQQMVADTLINVIADGLTIDVPTSTAFTPKSSFDFVHKYEADSNLPTVEDSGAGKTNWTLFDHAAVDAGFTVSDGALSYSTMATIAGGDWFYSNSAVSGSAWAAEIDESTSFTVEFRAKVTDGDGAVPGLHITTSAGSDQKIWLTVTPDQVATSDGYTIKPLGFGDNATDYHTFRMAYDAVDKNFTFWRDDVRIADDVLATTTGVVYLGFGDMSSSGSGAAEIDYFRWDATGAYAPEVELQPAYTPPSTTKSSANFNYKYEMDVNPTNPVLVDHDSNGVADWNNWSGSSAQVSVSGGKMLMPDGASLDSGIDNANAFWPTTGFTASEGFTFETSLEVLQQNEGTEELPILGAIAFVFALSDSNELISMFIGKDSITWDNNLLVSDINNADSQHVFRIARDSNADGGRWWLWRDEELLTPEGTLSSQSYPRNAMYFGPGISSKTSGSVEIDYVRLIEGAFAPEETAKIPGDANNDGRVDGSDVTILAGNWQTLTNATWNMGDFNGDGRVDGSDVTILAGNWQHGVGTAAASVPEPNTILLLLMGTLVSCFFKRRYR